MGMIKLPNESIDFFKANQDQIFESGALAEGSWNNQVQDWICQYTNSTSSLSTSSNGTGLLGARVSAVYRRGPRKLARHEPQVDHEGQHC